MIISRMLKSRLGAWLRRYVPIGQLSYSQEGEDLLLARILGEMGTKSGFYVDIGAHHPTRYSNTYYFYRRGWRGINVDALPGTKETFKWLRSRDITIESGVGSSEGELQYYVFNEPALNTFSEQEARKKENGEYRIVETRQVPVVTLKRILDANLPTGMSIEFMSVDVEGLDHEVIASNDWQRYRPRVILVELLGLELSNLDSHRTAKYLYDQNYRLIAKALNTCFFVANEAFMERDAREAACGEVQA